MRLTVHLLSALPPVSLSGLTKDVDYHRITTNDYVRVRVHVTGVGTSLSVRPYYKFEGAWWPLRGDGDPDVSIKPVTATDGQKNNRADGFYHSGGMSAICILVEEASTGAPVAEAYLDISDCKS